MAMNNRELKSWCCQEWVTQEVVQTYAWEHLDLQFIKCGCVAHIYHFYSNTKAESTVFIKKVNLCSKVVPWSWAHLSVRPKSHSTCLLHSSCMMGIHMSWHISVLGLMVWGRKALWSFRWDKALVCSYRSPYIDPTALAPLQLLFYHLWAPYISLKPMCNSLGIQKCAKLLCKGECIIELWLVRRDSKSLCLSCLSPLDEPHRCWQTEAQSKKVGCTRSWKEG